MRCWVVLFAEVAMHQCEMLETKVPQKIEKFLRPQKLYHRVEYSVLCQLSCQLELKNETKLLGIVLDSYTTFISHINDLCRKLNLSVSMMRAVQPYFDEKL